MPRPRARLIYFGTPEFAVAPLRALLRAGHEVSAVVTVPDRPAGRGKRLRPSAVKEVAQELGLRLLQPENLRDEAFVRILRDLRPEIGVVVAFRRLPREVYSLPSLGFFNLHASLLPNYRGAAPINWALIRGEVQTGVTTFLLDEGIDQGRILLQERVEIPPDMNAGALHDCLMGIGAELVVRTVDGLLTRDLTARAQVGEGDLHGAPKIFRADCRIDWHRPAREVHNLVRGLSPQPGAWTTGRGGDGTEVSLKILRAEALPGDGPARPGEIRLREGEVSVRCGDGWLRILELQPEGRKRMETAAYLRGNPLLPHVFD